MNKKVLEYQKNLNKKYGKEIINLLGKPLKEDGIWGINTDKVYKNIDIIQSLKVKENFKKENLNKNFDSFSKLNSLYVEKKPPIYKFKKRVEIDKDNASIRLRDEKGNIILEDEVGIGKTKGDFNNIGYYEGFQTTPSGIYNPLRMNPKINKGYEAKNNFFLIEVNGKEKVEKNPITNKKYGLALHGVPSHLVNQRLPLISDNDRTNNNISAGCINCKKKVLDSDFFNNDDFYVEILPEKFGKKQFGGNNTQELIQQYIQAKGLNEQQAQQLIQELQQLDEQQLQQVIENMQQQLGGDLEEQPTQEGVEMMQHGGKKTYEQWKQSLPNNLKNTDTTLYNLKGAYEAGLVPEMTEDGFYHLGSRNPKTGELLKYPKHPTFNKMIEGEKKAGYEVFEKNGKLYSRPKLKQQYGGIPVSMDGLYEYENTPVIVPNGNITMEGIDYPVDAYNADTGEFLETMYPDEDYNFDANNVLEIPKGKFGISKMQSGGGDKIKVVKNKYGRYEDSNGKFYFYDDNNKTFVPVGTGKKPISESNFEVVSSNKELKTKPNVVEFKGKSGKKYKANYIPEMGLYVDSGGNIWDIQEGEPPYLLESGKNPGAYTEAYKETKKTNTLVKTNPNVNTGNNSGNKPVRDFGITKNSDNYGFVKDLKKVPQTRQENITAYKDWVGEWKGVISGFEKLPYDKQQTAALNWIKQNQGKLDYEGVLGQLNNWGYKDSPDKLLTDGMFAEGTNLMRPSNLIGKEDPLPLVENVVFPNANTNQQSSVQEIPEVALPKEEGVDESNDEVNMDDVVLGKLNNNDYSGRYLSNMKLRNNIIKLPYFGRTDLKIPGVYTQNISPYLNEIYSVNNAYKQNTDLNSAIGQAAQMQLGANTMDRINKISGSVYNNNQQQKVNWENSLAGIYNQQQQVDEQNRRNYDDDVNRTIANKQNIDNIIDRMAYEFKQMRIRNKNNMLLSQMLHPNYVITDDGTMIRKPSPFNKGYADYLQEQNEKLSKENEELKTRVAKYGIKRRKK